MSFSNRFGRGFAPALLLVSLSLFVVACSESDDNESPGPDESPDVIDSRGDVDVPGPEVPGTGTDGSIDTPSCSATATVSWNAAVDNVGNEVSLIGPVFEVSSSGSETSIVIGSPNAEPATRVEVVLTENALNDIEGDAADLYASSEVCAIGVIQSVEGNLQMVINEAGDIQKL